MKISHFLSLCTLLSLQGVLYAESIVDRTIPHSQKPLDVPDYTFKNPPKFQLPPIQHELVPEQESALKMNLKSVSFKGNTLFNDETLQQLAMPFIGTKMTTSELEELRLQISELYSENGYINSGALLSEQGLSEGMIQFEIIEGHLSQINIEGEGWLSEHYIRSRLIGAEDEKFNVKALQERFQLLLLDPLIDQMNAQLIPGSQRGESILELDVTRARPYQLSLGFNNFHPPSVGSDQGQLSGWVHNLTGFGDKFSGSLSYGEGSLGASGRFSILPLNAYETRLYIQFNMNDSSIIEAPLDKFDIESKYLSFETGIIQPIIKTLHRNFDVGMSFTYKENQTTLLGDAFSFSEGAEDGVTKDSVLRFSLDFTERLPHHVFSARSVTNLGLNVLDATWHNDDRADGNFVSWLGQLQYAGKILDTDGVLVLRGNMQYADEKLLPLERFSLGGRYSVRGYRQNEVVRDKGFSFSAELRYPLFNQLDKLPGELTLFSFMDYGGGWNHGEKEDIAYLHSIGVGLEWQPIKYLQTEIVYAHDLNSATQKAEYNLQDSGLHWQFTLFAF